MDSNTSIEGIYLVNNEVDFSSIQGLTLIKSFVHQDSRGTFAKLISNSKDESIHDFKMDNLCISKNLEMGTLRGLHFQTPPYAEDKIVFCTAGSLFDVVVDLRNESLTRGKWAKIILEFNSEFGIRIPKGFAHGYQTLQPNTDVLYIISSQYNAENSYVLNYNDSALGIKWPLNPGNVSERDLSGFDSDEAIRVFNRVKNK
jgi:dTDP-4-dehydrorhamnose 3,5-epimerase